MNLDGVARMILGGLEVLPEDAQKKVMEVTGRMSDVATELADALERVVDEPESNAAQQPDAESGGSEYDTLDTILNSMYDYLEETTITWRFSKSDPNYGWIRQSHIDNPKSMFNEVLRIKSRTTPPL